MLCLSRKERGTILIGDNIVVRVERISGDSVRLSIDAPKDVRILRGELLNEPERNKETTK